MILIATRHAANQFNRRMGTSLPEQEAKEKIESSEIIMMKPRRRDKDAAVLLLCAGGYALVAVPARSAIDEFLVVTVLSRGNLEYVRLKLKADALLGGSGGLEAAGVQV